MWTRGWNELKRLDEINSTAYVVGFFFRQTQLIWMNDNIMWPCPGWSIGDLLKYIESCVNIGN